LTGRLFGTDAEQTVPRQYPLFDHPLHVFLRFALDRLRVRFDGSSDSNGNCCCDCGFQNSLVGDVRQ
jgi:hypothetical protein